MARYVDLEELKKRIRDNVLSDDNATPYETDLIEWCKDECIRQGYAMPRADVAPKSEVDKLHHEYHAINYALKQEKMYHRETEKLADKYCVELQTAKAEVAREIFEDIDKAISEQYPIYTVDSIIKGIAEIEKKYVEEKEND